MDLKDQLSNLFPDHVPQQGDSSDPSEEEFPIQKEPLLCVYEKRKGKPITLIKGYMGSEKQLKLLAQKIKTKFSIGGSCKNGVLLLQGNNRNKIMELLQQMGYVTKRVGG